LRAGFTVMCTFWPRCGEEVHEALDGKGTARLRIKAENVRLLNAEDLASFGLLEAATSNEV